MELRQPRKPSRGAIASPRRGGALTMLDEATRTELLDRLRAQEEAQLPYGVWVYQVWNAGVSELPTAFNSARFTAGLDALTATPSYRELVAEIWGDVQSAVPGEEIGGHVPSAVPGATTCTPISDPLSWVVLGQDENTITLLGPEQFYAFDGTGWVCHEFVRYIAQPNGTILAQEIVKRVFDPADGGRELVIRETVGSAGSLWAAPQHETLAGSRTGLQHNRKAALRPRRHCQPPLGVSEGLETYDVLWQVGGAQSGRLVLQCENDGETARLVLDEMGSTMTKELTDWQTGPRFHQGSTLAASEIQWFPADPAEGDTVVRVDDWFGFEADGSGNRPKNARKVASADPSVIPRAVVRTCVVQTTKSTTGTMHAYIADLFDMKLGLDEAVYALPTTDTTIITVKDTGDDDSDSADATSTASLSDEESQCLTSLASDLIHGLIPLAAGGCDPTYKTLTISIEGLGLTAPVEGSHQYLLNEEVEIQATNSDSCFSFDHWEGAASGSSNPVTVTMDDDKSVTAVFELNVLVDLTGVGLDGQVTNGNEVTPGIFIHKNIDNDNGNTVGDLPIQDRVDTTDPVTGENDLVPMMMEMYPVPTYGQVSLTAAENGIRIWKSATKGSANFLMGAGPLTWSLADTDERNAFILLCYDSVSGGGLFVEGVSSNATTLTLDFTYGGDTVEDELRYRPISANCGDQPTPFLRSTFCGDHPNLVHCEWSITGPATEDYNCLAFSVDDPNYWYNGEDIDECGDSDGIVEIEDLDAFYDEKAELTPIPSNRENPQNDAKVIAFYVSVGNRISMVHAAKKRECNCGQGEWIMFESKMGANVRIEHVYDQVDWGNLWVGKALL